MGTAKLKKPLFHENSFNKDGRCMRAEFIKEVSNGVDTFRLWRSAGKPDMNYPRGKNDEYILYVEVNDYLATLRRTEYALIDECGWFPALDELYGGKEYRAEYLNNIYDKSKPGDTAFECAMEREKDTVNRYGNDPVRQANCIKRILDESVDTYQMSKQNGGDTFPDFIGALVLDELDICQGLSVAYREKQKKSAEVRRQERREKDVVLVEEKNAELEATVSEAISILQNGGVLKNDNVYVYTLTEDSYKSSCYSLVNYLMRRFNVEVPLRTQGWIANKLTQTRISNGRCATCSYYGKKGAKSSDVFGDCMDKLIAAANAI